MPYARKTLSQLRADTAADISAALQGADPLLRFSVLKVIGTILPGLAHEHYGYLDWIAKQCTPFTAEDEYLEAWGALRKVYRKAASAAQLLATFPGALNTPLSAGTSVDRGDGAAYTVLSTETVGSGLTVTVTLVATVPGAAGNSDPGTVMSLGTSVPGIQSTGAAGAVVSSGSDIEIDDDFRTRVLAAYQRAPQGGDEADYVQWATDVAGVTRAWCAPNAFGDGTVVVYIMLDNAQASNGGFPQGTDGVSQNDKGPQGLPRGVVATGDQLVVADAIVSVAPVTALVYVCSPIRNTLSFVISGLSGASTSTRTAIESAISDVLFRTGDPRGGAVNRSDINDAISSVANTPGFVIEQIQGVIGTTTTTYPDNIVGSFGSLPVMGTISYT